MRQLLPIIVPETIFIVPMAMFKYGCSLLLPNPGIRCGKDLKSSDLNGTESQWTPPHQGTFFEGHLIADRSPIHHQS